MIAVDSFGTETGRAFSVGTTTFPPFAASFTAEFVLGELVLVEAPLEVCPNAAIAPIAIKAKHGKNDFKLETGIGLNNGRSMSVTKTQLWSESFRKNSAK